MIARPRNCSGGSRIGVDMPGLPSLGDAEQTIDDEKILSLVAFELI